jgi:hypothetical protein
VSPDAVDLYWLPLGAGGRVVRANGRLYEALVARRDGRRPQPLFHTALVVTCGGVPHVVEMAPVWAGPDGGRGVVAEGPVGWRPLGRWRLFRYEVRRWAGGSIPDVTHAVGGPRRLSTRAGGVRAVLGLVPEVPALTWGRDELGLGEMWNSNSLVAWLLAASGHDLTAVRPPSGGRAPGWTAGLALAARTDRLVPPP